MAAVDHVRHVLVTGRPGVGKTTLVKQVVDHFMKEGVEVHGFYTEEVRDGNGSGKGGQRSGPRVGFDVVDIKGKRGQLARAGGSGGHHQPMVGKYSVSVPSFEEVALPALRVGLPPAYHIKTDHLLQEAGAGAVVQRSLSLLIVDEIGKMELFSHKFEKEVRDLFDRPGVVLLGTVPLQSRHRSCSLVDQLVSRKDVRLFEVKDSNREAVLHSVTQVLKHSLLDHR